MPPDTRDPDVPATSSGDAGTIREADVLAEQDGGQNGRRADEDGGVVADPEDLAEIDIDDEDVITGTEADAVAPTPRQVRPSTITGVAAPPPRPARAVTVPPTPPPRALAAITRPPSLSEPLVPRQLEVEIPTALDRYLEADEHGDPASRAEALARELESAEGPMVAELAYELGELQLCELGDEAKAVKSYGKALQVDPSLRANLWAIRRIFYRRGLWPNLVKLIGAEIRFVKTDRERADLELEKGRLLEDRLGQPDDALECYRRALAHDPTYLPALYALERRALIDGDRAAQAAAWRALADNCESSERKQVYLLDLAEALAETGDHDAAFAAIDEAGACEGELAAVARVRARLARAADDTKQLVTALDERMRARLAELGAAGLPPPAPRDPSTPPDRAESIRLEIVALRRRQAHLLREAGDSEGAWIALEQALAAAPGEELVLSGLADLAEQLGKFDELAELVEGWQAAEVEPERARALALRRVNALRRSDKIEQARALLEQLGATSPGYVPISAAREADAIAAGDLATLSTVYDELAESAATGGLFGAGESGDRSAAAVFHTAAAAAAQLTGDRTRATALYMAALSEDPSSTAALDGLIRCLEAEGDHAAICDTLQARAADLDAAGRIRWANAERGRESWARAAEILEPIADQLEDDELLWLCLYWERAGDVSRAAATLVRAAERAGDPAKAGELFARAARLIDRTDPEAAVELYGKAIAARPEDRLTRNLYHALLRRRRDWETLAEALRDAAATGAGAGETAAIWGELAAVLEDRLRRPEEAAAAYGEMAALTPDDPVAVAGLLRVSRGEALVDALERAAAAADPRLRLDALVRLARAHADAGNADAALEAAGRAAVAEIDAGLDTAVADLVAIEIAARTGEPEPLARVLEEASTRQGARLGSALLSAAGWERVLDLEDPDNAALLFEQARELDPKSRDALFGLLVCRAARGERGLEATAAAELAAVLEGTQLAPALFRASAAVAAVEGDEPEATRRWSAASQRGPDDLASAIAATELAPQPDRSLFAAAAQRRAAAGDDPRANDRWQLERARGLEAAGKLAEAGQLVLELCQRERPDPAALDLLATIAHRGGDHRTEAIALAALADAGISTGAVISCLRRAASLFDHIGDPASAAAALIRLVEIEPTAPELSRLLEICEAADDRAQLWELLSARLETDIDDAERAALLRRRASVRRKLGDDIGAARDLEASLEIEDRPDAHLAMANALASSYPANAAAALRRYLAADLAPAERADAEVRLAEILAESSGDLAGAAAELAAAIELRPDDLELRERRVGLLLRAGDGESAIAAIEEVAEHRESAAERSRDHVRIAEIARDKLGDRERAVMALDRARQLDPLNLDAVKQLVELVGGNARRMDAILTQVSAEIWRALQADPGARGLYQKLAAVAGWRGESERQRLALAAAAALAPKGDGAPPPDEPPSFSGGPIDRAVWSSLAPAPDGFLAALWAVIGPAISSLRDPEPAAVGLGRGDRARGRQLTSRFPTLSRMIERLVLDVEIYIGSERSRWARVTSAERPLIYLSADVAAAETAASRFLLGNAVALARDRTGTLEHVDQQELRVYVAAAASLAGVEPIDDSDRKAVASAAEALDRAMSRRAHKELHLLARRFSELNDPAAWRRAALATARRFGLALAGDLGAALSEARSGEVVQNDPVALDLIRFAASPEHVAIREVLGYPVNR